MLHYVNLHALLNFWFIWPSFFAGIGLTSFFFFLFNFMGKTKRVFQIDSAYCILLISDSVSLCNVLEFKFVI